MLSLMRGQTDIGIYGASYKIFETLIALSALFVGVIFPIMSGYLERKESDKFKSAMQKSVDFLSLLSYPLVVTCLILAPAIIKIVAGEAFITTSTVDFWGAPATAVTALQILSLTLIFSYQTNIYNNMIIACGKQNALVWPNLLFLVINIGMNWWAIPRFSYVGAAWTTVITEICVLAINWYLLHKFIEFKITFIAMAKGILAALAMALVMWLTRDIMILVPLTFGFGVYFLVAMILRAVSWETVHDIVLGKKI
jgi:O-antigen/teichoic acid export membrane protein